MIAYAFRFVDESDQPIGWYGFAFAQNMEELFWEIDAHGDPYQCQTKILRRGSSCFLMDDEGYIVEQEPEVYIDSFADSRPWKKPKWEKINERRTRND